MIEITKLSKARSRKIFGGKAQNLSKLLNKKFNVPDGIVLSSELIKKTIKEKNSQKIKNEIMQKIVKEIGNDSLVAVRSSDISEDGNTSSFAGMYQTKLNIPIIKEKIFKAIYECWNSSNMPHVKKYTAKKKIVKDNKMSIIVQKMVNADISGVVFSKATVNNSHGVIIEAVRGLGENLVSGKITPERIVIQSDTTNSNSFKSKILDGKTIKKIVKIASQIEKCFGRPQDIEWAIENGKLFILQTRPITANIEYADNFPTIINGIYGYGVSTGSITAKSRIIKTKTDLKKFKKGEILVAKNTETEYLNAMMKAGGIITEEGGLLSHAALIARELKIPCIVGVPNALKTIPDNQIISLNAENGRVTIGETIEQNKIKITPYNTSLLYCFDNTKEMTLNQNKFLIEIGANETIIHPAPGKFDSQSIEKTLSKRYKMPVKIIDSPKYQIWKSFKRRMEHRPLFKKAFNDLVQIIEKNNSIELDDYLNELMKTSEKMRKDITKKDRLIDQYIKLDTINGYYMLSNTFIPEGYGIRYVYQKIEKYLTKNNISFSHFLENRKNIPKKMHKLVELYDTLADWREKSFNKYESIKCAGKEFDKEFLLVKKKLNLTK